VIRSRVLRTWGSSESGLAELLDGRIAELDALGGVGGVGGVHGVHSTAIPTIAFLASGVEGLKVRITAKAPTGADVDAILDHEEQLLRRIIGDLVFGIDDQNMETVVVEALRQRGLTVAVAESLTGGYVAGRICSVPGASEVFRGALVAYQPDLKHELLAVPPGPVVTEEAALAMANGVRRLLGSDVGLATTGVAGPDEAEGLPVGTVCLAAASGDQQASTTVRLPGDRERIRQFSAITLLDLLRRRLL
jgi:nicotinamide-nucleotide amidase